MATFIKILCLLLVIAALPLWLMFAGFSPMLFDAGASMTKAQKLLGGALMAIIVAVPVWVIYFAWRTFKGWSTDNAGNAVLMALPAVAMIGFILALSLGKFAP